MSLSALLIASVIVLGICTWAIVRVAQARHDRDIYMQTFRWTDDELARARQDAVLRSRSVVSGKVQEHLAPLFPQFIAEFDPREARFIGSPVDYVIFDGLGTGQCEVVFVEVKTGRSQLSAREKAVRQAVEAGRVRWVEMRLPGEAGRAVGIRADGGAAFSE